MWLDSNNTTIAQYLTGTLSIISLFCSMFFVIMFIVSRSQKFYLKLVFYLQISDSILAFGLFFCFFDVQNNEPLCRLQSFLIQFGSLSSVFWRTAISIVMYVSIKMNAETAEAQELPILLALFWLSLILSIIPFCSGDYGYWNIWCWVSRDSETYKKKLLIYFIFYGELWFSMIVILIMTILIARKLKNENRKSCLRKFINRLKYYPLVFIMLWLILSIDKIVSSDQGHYVEMNIVFSFLHAIAISSQGFANFLLYGLSYMRKIFKKKSLNKSTDSYKDPFLQLVTRENEEKKKIMEISDGSFIPSEEMSS